MDSGKRGKRIVLVLPDRPAEGLEMRELTEADAVGVCGNPIASSGDLCEKATDG